VPKTSPLIRNRLLLALSDSARAKLGAHEFVELSLRETLESAGQTIPFVHFPESGLLSVVSNETGKAVEVGMIGYEGMSGLSIIAGDRRATFDTMVQGAGTAWRVKADRLREAFAESGGVRDVLLRYSHAFAVQVASTASANAHAKLETRLARWLLMVADRLGDTFHITHEFLGIMLAVRRSGVTLALQILEGKGFIRATRGTIRIVDRAGLAQHTEGAYGKAEREYERIMSEREVGDAVLFPLS
jgi:CRP-like cAMP-binding protein